MNQHEKLDVVMKDIQYIKSMLEDNKNTGQKGVVNLSNDNKVRIDNIEMTDKIRLGKIGVAGTIFGFIGALIFKIVLKFI